MLPDKLPNTMFHDLYEVAQYLTPKSRHKQKEQHSIKSDMRTNDLTVSLVIGEISCPGFNKGTPPYRRVTICLFRATQQITRDSKNLEE